MSRYALCLHGMAFGVSDIGNKVDWTGAYPYFTRNVLRPDVDVFCHTWTKQMGPGPECDFKDMVTAFGAKSYTMELQKEFPGSSETRSIYSRWYSAAASVKLATQHVLGGSLPAYDGILLCRYDVALAAPFPWMTLAPGTLLAPAWKDRPAAGLRDEGLLDYWFYGSQDGIESLSKLDVDALLKRGVRQNGHPIVGNWVADMGVNVLYWGRQFKDFELVRRFRP